MGVNHTYRYVKTSGLGIVPYKWTGDVFSGYWGTSIAGTPVNFVVLWLDTNGYRVISVDQRFHSEQEPMYFSNAKNQMWNFTFESGVLNDISFTVRMGIPYLYDVAYGKMCGYNQYESNFESLRSNCMGCYLTYLVNGGTSSINFWIRAENINNFGYQVDTTGFISRASNTSTKGHAVPARLIYYDTSLLV